MTDEPTTPAGESLEKPPKKGTFKKGFDPRRNLRGTPREAIEYRKLLRKIAAELVKIKDEGGNEVEVTRLYARARLAFSSRNPKEFENIIKALYPGALKEEHGFDGDILVRIVDETSGNKPPETPPNAG